MAQTDVERLSRLMLDEFGRVHKRFDDQDDRFDRLDAELTNVRATLKQLRSELDDLREKVDNITGIAGKATTRSSGSPPSKSTWASTKNS